MLFRVLHRAVLTQPTTSFACGVHTKFAVPDAGIAPRRKRLRPKIANDKFTALTSQFLDRVETAVAPLHPPMNKDFVLERDGKNTLTIRSATKEFEIKAVAAKQQIHFTSPISGLRMYEWNAKTQRWEDETDSHDIEGLLTRDLMRVCSGIPLF